MQTSDMADIFEMAELFGGEERSEVVRGEEAGELAGAPLLGGPVP